MDAGSDHPARLVKPKLILRATRTAERHLKYFGWLLVIAASAQMALRYFDLGIDVDQNIDRATIILGFFVLLLGSIWREETRIRKEKYANITDHYHAILHYLRDLQTYIGSLDVENADIAHLKQSQKDAKNQITFALDKVVEIYSILTGTACRASIKGISDPGDGRLYAYAMARDSNSNKINFKIDRERHENREDAIEGNEDFNAVFNDERPYFFSNDLTRQTNYRNTSFARYGRPPSKLSYWQICFPSFWWTLPYRSTIVWPIQQKESDKLQFEVPGCIGFLAIDSGFRGVFRDRFDIPLGAGLADAFFHPLYLASRIDKSLAAREENANG